MYDPNFDSVPSTNIQSASLLSRSKSYDTKLNTIVDNQIYSGIFSTYNPEHLLKSDEPAKITITSFAPTPNENRNKIINYGQVSPSPQTLNSYSNGLNFTETNKNNSSSNKNENQETNNRNLSLIWSNGRNNLPLILFRAKVLRKTYWECKKIGETYRLTFKFIHGERKLVKAILEGHGFREVHPNSSEFNVIWSGNNLKSYLFRGLQENQKVNHFPRSCELTRKDRLYKNIQRMQKEKGQKSFNIVPTTFVLPYEIDDFYSTFYKEKGIWIVKPVCLSRGRGIYLISHPDQIPLEDNLVVSKYLSNPLLIEGFKFDLRLYVAVTSFDPLVFYLYEEGLTRFATIKYDQNVRNIRNTCMHLTNYSVNKKNEKYVKCDDPEVENYGNKWSMSALLRYLSAQGKDTFTLMMNIEEVLIKTMLSVESPMASAARMFIPHRGNCFELFGFDILIDEFFKPWVLEVNLSPSLDCDALLDIRIKSNMVADLFTLAGIYCQNPNAFSNRSRQKEFKAKNDPKVRVRPHSASNPGTSSSKLNQNQTKPTTDGLYDGLSQTETNIIKVLIEENQRSNGWVRLFPTSDTWEFYSQYLETRSTSYNMTLHKKLFPRRWHNGAAPKKAAQTRVKALESAYEMYKINNYLSQETNGASFYEALDRYNRYERKLNDQVKPNDETLRKLSNSPFKIPSAPVVKTNFNLFPNGDRFKEKDSNLSSDLLNEEEYLSDSTNDVSKTKSEKNNKKPLLNIKNRPVTANYLIPNYKPNNVNNKKKRKSNKKAYDNNSEEENSDFEDNFSDTNDDEKKKNDFMKSNKNVEIKYDLNTVLKYLDQGYYLSRIQVRNAFALYLFKIQSRLLSESQLKDESNLQQMDLVLRFIKKAAPNLSQDFKVYVPSKRLPLSEQKRMLSKQLHDFLHIYRKDTEQIRVESGVQLENERKKNRNKLIDDKAFQALLYKSNEADLEEIMSAYMKNSQDSSVFLGTGKNGASKTNESNANNNGNGTHNFIDFKLTKNETKTDELEFEKFENETSLNERNDDKEKKKNTEEDISSFDTHSEYSKSSDSDAHSRSRSRSSSSGSVKVSQSAKKTNKSFKERKIMQKMKQKNFIATNIKNSSGKLLHFETNSPNKEKTKFNKTVEYQTTICDIYSSNNKSAKPRPKTNPNKGFNRTNTFKNSSSNLLSANKLAPLTINSQMSNNSNQVSFHSPMSTSSKDSLPISPLKLNSVLNQQKQSVNNTNLNFQKPGSVTNRSIGSTGQNFNGLDEASVLSMGLKNLQLKQQERVYSAAKSFRVPTSLDNEDNVLHKPPNTLKNNKTTTQSLLKAAHQNSDEDFEVKRLKEITSITKSSYSTGFDSYFVDPTETATIESISSIKKNSLIEKLEKQKEKTHKLLEKSKQKRNQMLLNHSSISVNRKNPTDNLNLYFSTVKN